MQAVVDETVIGNANPVKVLATFLLPEKSKEKVGLHLQLNFYCFSHLGFCSVVTCSFFQHPSTWTLGKLLKEFAAISGDLSDGKFETSNYHIFFLCFH